VNGEFGSRVSLDADGSHVGIQITDFQSVGLDVYTFNGTSWVQLGARVQEHLVM
jgi:hypothetical protein